MEELVRTERENIRTGIEVVEEIPLWGKITLLVGEFLHVREETEEGVVIRSPRAEEMPAIYRLLK